MYVPAEAAPAVISPNMARPPEAAKAVTVRMSFMGSPPLSAFSYIAVAARTFGKSHPQSRERGAGAQAPLTIACASSPAYQLKRTFLAWHPATEERTGANRSAQAPRQFPWYARTRAVTDVTSQTLRRWRESKGWDVP